MSYFANLTGEDLSRYLNKIESVELFLLSYFVFVLFVSLFFRFCAVR